jgi:hypothetical protein
VPRELGAKFVEGCDLVWTPHAVTERAQAKGSIGANGANGAQGTQLARPFCMKSSLWRLEPATIRTRRETVVIHQAVDMGSRLAKLSGHGRYVSTMSSKQPSESKLIGRNR